MDPIALAAGTALVTAMTTDAWQQARSGIVALWRRIHPGQADAVEAELGELRGLMLAARRDGDADTERALVTSWQIRLQRLLHEDPALITDLRRILDEELTPPLTPAERIHIGSIVMHAVGGGSGQIYQNIGNQHITGWHPGK
ncbi:hypothetical protein [Streptosporangium sp. NPDC051022]|uniref:hypothetical protein n=1 Tax=Streptosporangium sp. NPDC051022 TaxID=3155752 RepID=UPI00343EFEEE